MADTRSPINENHSSASNSVKRDDDNPFVSFFLNLFQAIKLPSPQKNTAKIEPSEHVKIQPSEPLEIQQTEPIKIQPAEALNEDDNSKSLSVLSPAQSFVPLKLEDESNQVAETKSNPVIIWQVYAIGGCLILWWAWGKWRGRKKPDDDTPPARN